MNFPDALRWKKKKTTNKAKQLCPDSFLNPNGVLLSDIWILFVICLETALLKVLFLFSLAFIKTTTRSFYFVCSNQSLDFRSYPLTLMHLQENEKFLFW